MEKLKGTLIYWNERHKVYGSSQVANSPDQTWFTQKDVERIRQAGGNCIEIMSIDLGEISENYLTNWLDVWVKWITNANMYCIINLKGWQASYNTLAFYDVNNVAGESQRAMFKGAWASIAERYKSNPHVIFGIMNEPFNGVSTGGADDYYAQCYSTLMEQVIDAIRAAGATQLVLVDTPFLSAFKPINRPNFSWESHHYIASWRPTYADWKRVLDDYIDTFVRGFGQSMFVGEFGFDPATIYREYAPESWQSFTDMVSYLDSQAIIGRSWHCYGYLHGQYYQWEGGSDLTQEDSDRIISVVFGGTPPPTPPTPSVAARVPCFGNRALVQVYLRRLRDKVFSRRVHERLHPLI